MNLRFRTIDGEIYEIDADPNTTVLQVIEQIQEKYNFRGENIKMIQAGRVFDDNDVILNLQIVADKDLVLYIPKNQRNEK